MSYQVILSYDLYSATAEDYECVSEGFQSIGYENELQGNNGKVETPSTTFRKVVSGTNSSTVRNSERNKIKQVMNRCKASSFFMVFCWWQ